MISLCAELMYTDLLDKSNTVSLLSLQFLYCKETIVSSTTLDASRSKYPTMKKAWAGNTGHLQYEQHSSTGRGLCSCTPHTPSPAAPQSPPRHSPGAERRRQQANLNRHGLIIHRCMVQLRRITLVYSTAWDVEYQCALNCIYIEFF